MMGCSSWVLLLSISLCCQELKPGDCIQAKWVDGRMYFGKVMKVHGGKQLC